MLLTDKLAVCRGDRCPLHALTNKQTRVILTV